MKRLMYGAWALMMLAGANAFANETPVADCTFNDDEKGYRDQCEARATICLKAAAPGAAAKECGKNLVITCGRETVFSGEWDSDAMSNPDRFFIYGVASHDYPIEPKIEILSRPSEGNPARMVAHDYRFNGKCRLYFPTAARLAGN